jgi:hypothetical protein
VRRVSRRKPGSAGGRGEFTCQAKGGMSVSFKYNTGSATAQALRRRLLVADL